MTEYESTYRAKMKLLELLKNQLEVEKSVKDYKKSGDVVTSKILAKRYNEMNEEIFKAAQTFIALADVN